MGRSKNKRNALSILFAVMALLTVAGGTVVAQSMMRHTKLKHKFEIHVTGVNNTNRDGVTRVRCDIISFPHTSQRIDKVFYKGKGHNSEATDIDGVDFNRYFQWEDEGVIEIEVDFPKVKHPAASDSIIFETANGRFGTALGKFSNYQ